MDEERTIDGDILAEKMEVERKPLRMDVERLPPKDLLSAIAQAVLDPRIDVEKMERLLAMHERITAEQRKEKFQAAMARVAPKLSPIFRGGTSHQGKYARLIDIDRVLRPIIATEGLSQSFDSEDLPGDKVKVIGKLSHEAGHFEVKTLTLPIDKSGSKNGSQAVLSTVAYARRGITKMFFNLVEETEDTDGNDPSTITPEQAAQVRALIVQTKSDESKFLELIAGVPKIEDILARDFPRIKNALETKMRTKKKEPQI